MFAFLRVLAVGSLLLAATAWAAPVPAPSKDEIARWVQQLGDGSFAVREEATRKLWQAGREAEPALNEAAKSDDPEVARRARELLDKFKWGLYADTPPKVVELINRYQAADAGARLGIAKELIDHGTHGCASLVKIAAAEENTDVRRNVLQIVSLEAGRAIPVLLAEGNLTTLEDLLDLSVGGDLESAVPSYAAYHLLRGRLDEKIAHWKPLADKPSNGRAALVLTHLYRAKGDPAAARQAAEKANRADLVEAILDEQRDWKALANRPKLQNSHVIEGLGRSAAYRRLAGRDKVHRDAFEEIVGEIIRQAQEFEKAGDDAGVWLAAKVLFLNDRPQDALALLGKGRNVAPAFEILCAQLRFREALELADKSPEAPDRAALDVLRARTLHLLGEKEKAKEVFAKLAEQIREGNETPWAENMIQWEWRLGLRDEALEHCARALAVAKETLAPSRLLDKVFPRQGDAAWGWWRFLRQKYPGEEPAATMKRLRAVMTGTLAGNELTALAEEAERSAQALPANEREQTLLALAETCKHANLDAPARAYLEKAASVQNTPAVLLKLGDYLAQKKQWEQAAEQYGKAWEKDRKEPLPLYLRGWALVQGGTEKEGRKLLDLAHWLPLGNDAVRAAFAGELAKRGHADAARRERELLLKTSPPGSFHVGEVMRQVGVEAYHQKDYAKAADGHELAMLRVLRGNVNFVEIGAYVGFPHFVHRLRACGLVAAGKLDEARREIDLCLTLQPANIELAVLLVPELEKRGHPKEADELLKQLTAQYEQLCREHPLSASHHNSLAWMLACCRRQLDQALTHANKAVELAPEQAGYLDTLAEVHFQRGETAKALALMKKCIEMEPKRGFFRKQLKRFEAGDPKADLPSPLEDD